MSLSDTLALTLNSLRNMNTNAMAKTVATMLKTIVSLKSDPSQIKYTPLWVWTWLPIHSPLSDRVPYITFNAREWLQSYLNSDMSVFEYGSGGSTLFLAKRVNRLISVEHDRGWYEKVSSVLAKERFPNCELVLREPENVTSRDILCQGCTSYTTTRGKHRGMSFEKYVKSIEDYPDRSFDLVSVDGRARAACLTHALSKIRPGGYLMLDNSERKYYHDAISSLLTTYKRTDFLGIGPYAPCLWQTSIWEIRSTVSPPEEAKGT